MATVTHRIFASTRRFGIELETGVEIDRTDIRDIIAKTDTTGRSITVSNWAESKDNSYWHIKHDSSCGINAHTLGRDYGWEIASYVATGPDDIKNIANCAQKLQEAGLKANNNCGYHIHAEVKDFTADMFAVLMARWIKIEPFLSLIVPERRLHNKHCKFWYDYAKFDRKSHYAAKDLWSMVKPTNHSPHDNSQRKTTLNVVNFSAALLSESEGIKAKRKTAELRLPEGTLAAADISAWVVLFLSFIDNCVGKEMPETLSAITRLEEFLEYLGLSHDEGFTIFDEPLYNTKVWVLQRLVDYSSDKEIVSAARSYLAYMISDAA